MRMPAILGLAMHFRSIVLAAAVSVSLPNLATAGIMACPDPATISKNGYQGCSFIFKNTQLNSNLGFLIHDVVVESPFDLVHQIGIPNPTLTLGGAAAVYNNIDLYDGSTLIMNAGTIGAGSGGGGINANDTSNVTVNGGFFTAGASGFGQSKITINGGATPAGVGGVMGTTVTVNGGSIGGPVEGQGVMEIDGGAIYGGVAAHDGGAATIKGGIISGSVQAYNKASLFLDGGTLVNGNVNVDSNSKAIVSDVSVPGNASATDGSKLNMGGNVSVGGNVFAASGSTAFLDDLTVAGNVSAQDDASVTVYRGSSGAQVAGGVLSYGTATLTDDGGTALFAFASDSSTMTIACASITGNVAAASNATINFKENFAGALQCGGGTVGGNVTSQNSATINLDFVNVKGSVYAFGGTINMGNSAVICGDLFAYGGTVNRTGGQDNAAVCNIIFPGHSMYALNGGTINLFGTGLSDTLLDPNFVDPNTGLSDSEYLLSGNLLDGTSISGEYLYVQNDGVSSFALTNGPATVPEPSSLALLPTALAVGGIWALQRRRPSAFRAKGIPATETSVS